MKKAIVIIISISLFLSTAASAKAGVFDNLPGPEVMPDSPFYKIKIWYERIITFFSFGDISRAKRYSTLAERRLYEAEKMAEEGRMDLAEKMLEEYEKYLNMALEKAGEVKKEAEERVKERAKRKANEAVEMISESTLDNQEVLLRIYNLVPDEARSAVEQVINVTKTGYEWAIDAVSGIKKEELRQRAEEIKTKIQKLIEGGKKILEEK